MVLEDGSYDRVPFSAVLEMIERQRGVERVMERAHAFTGKSRALLSEFPESPYQKALYAVTELVTDRDH
jgi:octaprenyl-diphosphate synthase